jgi:hypothetical protein
MARKYTIHVLLIVAIYFTLNKLRSFVIPDGGNGLVVSVELKPSKPTSMQFFYTTSTDPSFSQDKSVWAGAKNPGEFQVIRYELPANIDPLNLRLDFGDELPENSTGDVIEISQVSIQKGKSSVVVPAEQMTTRFEVNGFVTSFENTGRIVTQRVGDRYDPYMMICSDCSELINSMTTSFDWRTYAVEMTIFITLAIAVFVSIPPIESQLGMILFSGIFILCLLLPTLSFNRSGESLSTTEKRELSKAPEFSFSKDFAKSFESYFNDNFGFRQELIGLGASIKGPLFGTAVNSERVMIGKEGWLYYNNSNGYDYIFKSYSHRNLFTDEELREFIDRQGQIKAKCDSSGIKYFLGFCPQTQTIYPEYMPFVMRIQIQDTISKADQVKAALDTANIGVKFIDLRPAIIQAKSRAQLYRKLDTHWNDYGAYIGYKSLFDQVAPELGITPWPITSFNTELTVNGGGDLMNMLAGAVSSRDTVPVFTPKPEIPAFVESTPPGLPDRSFITTCDSCTDNRTLMVFRDSYNEALVKYISTHFKKVIYVWWRYNQQAVDNLHPDIVIDLPVERYL